MATITEILASDNISDSRGDINTNFSNLNTDKLEASDITGKEDASNKKTTLDDNSDTFYPTQKAVKTAVDAKQDTLVSGTNIKTVNSTSLLGSGNIDISASSIEGTSVLSTGETGGTKFLREDGDGTCSWQVPSGAGDVVGGASSTDNGIARYNGETGKIIQNSGATVDDSGNIVANNIASGATVSGSNTGDQEASDFDIKDLTDSTSLRSTWSAKLSDIVDDTTPQLGGQLDINGQALGDGALELLKFEETASAVNEFTIKNAATGSAPEVKATGDDTDIDVKLTPKGAGKVAIGTAYKFPSADGTNGQVLQTNGSGVLSFATSSGGGSSLWTTFSGTRASNTTITVASDVTATFKKGMIIKWTDTTTHVGMVSIPSTESGGTTTITIIGDVCSADATDFSYCLLPVETMNFAVAGTIGATGADIANAVYARMPYRVLGADLQVGTAGSTNSTTIDINIAGTTCFTTKPTLATTVAASPTPFTADDNTSLTLNQRVSIDIDAVQTTAAVDLYAQLYLFPSRFLTLS